MKALEAVEPPSALIQKGHHGALHHDVLRGMAGAGLGASLAFAVIAVMGGSLEASPLFSWLVGAGALAGVASRRGFRPGVLGGGLGLLGTLLSRFTMAWTPLSAALFGLAVAPVLGAGERPKRMALTGLVGGAFAFAGLAVSQAVLDLGLLLPFLPYPLAVAGSGAVAGLFVGLATAPRHLLPAADPLDEAYEDALAVHDGEIHDLLTRALGLHHAIRDILAARSGEDGERKLRRQVESEARRVLKIGEACRKLDHELERDGLGDLERRAEQLRASASETDDPGARTTFHAALDSLEAQRNSIDKLTRGRARVVARLHVTLGLLDKLRLALLQSAAADTERFGAAGDPAHEALDALGKELDASASAISEIFGAGPAALPTPTHEKP